MISARHRRRTTGKERPWAQPDSGASRPAGKESPKAAPLTRVRLFPRAGKTVCTAAPPAITTDAREGDEGFIAPLWAGSDRSPVELWNFPRPDMKSISWKCFSSLTEGCMETARSAGVRLYLQSSGLQHFNLFPLKRLRGAIRGSFQDSKETAGFDLFPWPCM